MKKRLLVGILILTMLIACVAVNALAAAAEPKWAPIQSVKVGDSELTCTGGTGTGNTLHEVTANVSAFSDTKLTVTATEGTALSYYVSSEVKSNIFAKKSEQLDRKASEFKSLTSGVETKVEGLSADSNYIYIKAVLSGETKYAAIRLTETGYTSASDLATALGVKEYSSGDIKLAENVTLKAPITVATTATIDLNGKTITGNFANSAAIIVKGEGASLTITDSTKESKGTVTNSSSTAIEVTAAKLEVRNGVTISGASNVIKASHTGSSTNVKSAEVTIDGAVVKATDKTENALSGTGNVKLTIKGDATEITGQWSSTWGKDSSIEAGYFTFFQLNSKKSDEGSNVSILGNNCGFLPVDEEKADFTYKVGTVDTGSAEGYVELDGSAKVYGSIDMLVKFYGKTGKDIYVQKNATLTLAEFGDIVGGKYDDGNTLSFKKGGSASTVTLTINIDKMRVGLIKYENITVSKSIEAVDGYAETAEKSGEIKYDLDKDSGNAVAEVTIGDEKYTYSADSLQNLFITIQGKTATVKLLNNVTYSSQVELKGKTKLTLDLNGNTYTYNGSKAAAFFVSGTIKGESNDAAELTVTDSSVTRSAGILDCSKTDEAICVGDFTKEQITSTENKAIIDAGVTVKGSVTVIDKGTLDVYGAIEAKGFAVSGNGSRDGTTITIHNGASLKSDNTTAIYHPQQGTLTLGCDKKDSCKECASADGAAAPEITGVAGVVVRDGTVTVNDAKITATGDGPISVGDAKDAEGNPVPVPAGGIVLDTSKGYNETDKGSKVDVKKAEIQAEEGQPTVTHTADGKDVVQDAQVENQGTVTVTDGTFKSGDEGDSGVAEYLANNDEGTKGIDPVLGTIAQRDASWPDSYFEVGGKYYADLNDAISAAQKASQTLVTVLKDVEVASGANITSTIVLESDKDVTISGVGRILEVATGGNLTIKGKVSIDAADDKENEDNYAAIKVSGELTVKDGASITAVDTAIYVAGSGKLVMTGGDVKSTGEIAISSNGNDTTDPATITISGGTVTSDKTAAVYVPSGELTVSGSPEITGVAGIVVRGNGKATVSGTPTVTANGTDKFTVGDATTELEPKAVVVDAPKDDANTATVSGGTFEANGKPDYTVLNFVDTAANGVDENGTVKTADKDELFIVDFGYIANKADLGGGDTWNSPNGIVYNVGESGGKWGDATFYWCFNRALKEDEEVEITLTCDGKEFTDTCKDSQSARWASSLKNKDQLGDELAGDPITGGKFTLSSKDNKFTVSDDLSTVTVTLPKADIKGAPEISPAPTVNENGKDENTGDYTVGYTAVDTGSKTYSVTIDATNVTEHQNKNGDYGYWTGLAVKYDSQNPASAKGYYYKAKNGTWQYSALDKIKDKEGSFACIYFKDLGKYDFELVWTTDDKYTEESVSKLDGNSDQNVMTFHVTVDITHGESEREPAPVYPSYPTVSPTTVEAAKTENGSVRLSSSTASVGTKVTVTVTPDAGYKVESVVVTDRNGDEVEVTKNEDGTYTFTVPAATPVTVTAKFSHICAHDTLSDVDVNQFYHEAVDYMVLNGFIDGYPEGVFKPNAVATRGQMLTIMAAANGVETESDPWYKASVDWAVAAGYSDGTRPTAPIQREEIVTILWQIAKKPASEQTLEGYEDAGSVNEWAKAAMAWAVENGIIKGRAEDRLVPQGTATRAELAQMLYNYFNLAK